jgi:hypothetical protein
MAFLAPVSQWRLDPMVILYIELAVVIYTPTSVSLQIGIYYLEDPPMGSVAVDDDDQCSFMGTAGGQQADQRSVRPAS